jgi:hypothetical protein
MAAELLAHLGAGAFAKGQTARQRNIAPTIAHPA